MSNTEPLRPLESFNSLLELVNYFQDEKLCLQYLEYWCWRGCPSCPYCKHEKIYRYKNGVRFKCASCLKQFSAKVGTIFENSNLPMSKWFAAIYLITAHKKGISSHQLARDIEITQKSAWYLLHRIRFALGQDNTDHPDNHIDTTMDGVIEIDESFVGGKNKNRHKNKKVKNSMGRSFKDKTPVLGILREQEVHVQIEPAAQRPEEKKIEKTIARQAYAKLIVIPNTNKEAIQPHILQNVMPGSILVTDDWYAYAGLERAYHMKVVDHGRGQYVNQEGYTTNRIEGLWGSLKRAYTGVYHYMSPKYLQQYANEVAFRYNTRDMGGGQRMAMALSMSGCRLGHKALTSMKRNP